MPGHSLSRAGQWVHYWLEALDAHSLHGPFIFDLFNKVVKDRRDPAELAPLAVIRKSLYQNHQIIHVTDFGAGTDRLSQREISSIAQGSHNPKVARLLYRLARYRKPQSILELGTNLGLSTLHLALGAPQAQITTVEGCPQLSQTAQENFNRANQRQIKLYTGIIDDQLEQLHPSEGWDLVFIDANHKYKPTIKYFHHCIKEMRNNSVMVLDDIHWSADMTRAWDEIKSHPRVTLSVDLFQLGLVFFENKLEKHHYILEF